MINRNFQLDITPTVQELARVFAELMDDEQTIFFNEVGRIAREEWYSSALEIQMINAIEKGELNSDGIRFLKIIAETCETLSII